jgi:hypothetical protein
LGVRAQSATGGVFVPLKLGACSLNAKREAASANSSNCISLVELRKNRHWDRAAVRKASDGPIPPVWCFSVRLEIVPDIGLALVN